MRIAQVAPLFESVPPKLYGGTERVVSALTEELVERGHDVTLFASGDSKTRARLIPITPKATRLDPECRDPLAWQILQLEELLKRADEFDLIHFHTDLVHYPCVRYLRTPHVTTLHGRLDLPWLQRLTAEFLEIPVVSISLSQRKPLQGRANFVGNVYHGLPCQKPNLLDKSGDYAAFLGRMSQEKRADLAIQIARRAGLPLKLAAKVDPADELSKSDSHPEE